MQYDDKSNKTLREMATAFEAAKENVTPVRRKALATLANGCRGQVLSSLPRLFADCGHRCLNGCARRVALLPTRMADRSLNADASRTHR